MRVAIGLGLFAMIGILACAAESDNTVASATEPAPTDGTETGTPVANPPDEPAAPAPAPPPDPTNPNTPPAPIVPGLKVTDVAVFQAVKVPVIADGAAVKATSRKAPVVAKRPGVVRVYVTPTAGWTSRSVTAELRLVGSDKKFPIIRDTKTVTAASKEEDLASTFNLEVPGESLPVGVTFQVSLTAPDGDATAAAGSTANDGRYPRDGSFADLGAELSGKLKVVLVPVQYDADSSSRLPDLSTTQVELYKKTMMKMYPTQDVTVTTHTPFPWSSSIQANGNGFSNILKGITDLRAQDKVATDVYYYGVFQPKDSWQGYCSGGCVTGLSMIVDDPQAAGMRASVGVGYTGELSANTAAHEVGHAHGRMHAPCGGTRGPDPQFPYQSGGIGAWGYDIFAKTLISPSKGTDIMGYCKNQWVSDYTYNALFDRMAAISLEKDVAPQASTSPAASEYRVATVGASGDLSWESDISFHEAIKGGALRKASFYAESGATPVTRQAHFFAFDHLPGGFLFIPKDATVDATMWKTMEVEGFAKSLAR